MARFCGLIQDPCQLVQLFQTIRRMAHAPHLLHELCPKVKVQASRMVQKVAWEVTSVEFFKQCSIAKTLSRFFEAAKGNDSVHPA
jgi:hypothetical protein